MWTMVAEIGEIDIRGQGNTTAGKKRERETERERERESKEMW